MLCKTRAGVDMKIKDISDASFEAHEIALKTEGIAFLMRHFNQEGTGDRDRDAMIGISLILEDLAKKGHELSDALDTADLKARDTSKKAV